MTMMRFCMLVVGVLSSLAVSSAVASDFFVAPHYNMQFPPAAIATADLNQDGNSDWVLIDSFPTVTVMLSNGDGTFGAPQNYQVTGLSDQSIALADFNGDGKTDIAVCTSGGIAILFGNGDGTFQTATTVPGTTGAAAFASRLITADLNGDGTADLLTVHFGLVGQPAIMSVLLGNGDGTFDNSVDTALPYILGGEFVPEIRSLDVGDFNKDGKLDIAVVVPNTSVLVLLGNGDGTFQSPATYSTAVFDRSVAVADVNNDGKLDLVVRFDAFMSGPQTNNVGILLGNGDGTFQSPVNLFAGGCNTIKVADLNGDGKLDLIATGGAAIGVLLGNGDGSFHAPVFYLPTAPISSDGDAPVAIGDFDHDGKPDIVTADSNGISVLFNSGDGTLLSARSYDVAAFSMAAADFNGDGQIDLALSDGSTGDIQVLPGNPDGSFQTPALDLKTAGAARITAGDFNGDGISDIAAVNFNASTATVYLGKGDGTFQPPISSASGTNPQFITAGDLNGDGRLDLITANETTGIPLQGDITVLLGDGTGRFASPRHVHAGQVVLPPVLSDLNGDGFLDLVAGGSSSGVDVLLGSGNGTFGPVKLYPSSNSPSLASFAVGDLNSDGKPDIVTGNANANNVSVLMNRGDGTFAPFVNFANLSGASPIAISDFDGDGKADIAVGGLDILHGNGDGTFQSPVTYAVASFSSPATAILVADFNRDGAPDLAIAHSNTNTISILLNIHGASASLTSSAAIAVIHQPVTFTATIGPTFKAAGAPTGTVTFRDGNVNLGTAPLIGNQAQLTTSFSSLGTHSISGSYSGDGLFFPRSIAAVPVLILAAFPTNTAVTTSAPSILTNQNVTFTAQVTSPDANHPTGAVQFNDFGTPIGTAPLTGSSAALTTSALSVGPHLITAAYSGDAYYAPSVSLPLAQVVKNPGQADTTVTVQPNSNPVLFRRKLILTCTVSSNTGTPDGTVRFMDGETALTSDIPLTDGKATFQTDQLTIAVHIVTVVYGGTSSFAAGISPTLFESRSPRPR
jgi:hypothetical protein